MIIRRFLLAAVMASAPSGCASSYSFKLAAFPTNVAAHEPGWQYLAQVTIQDPAGAKPGLAATRKCRIKVIDARRNVLLSEAIEVQGGQLEPRIEWREGPLLLVSISSPRVTGASPLFEAEYRLAGTTFQRLPPSP